MVSSNCLSKLLLRSVTVLVWSSITVFTTLKLNLSHFSVLGIFPCRLSDEGRVVRVITKRHLNIGIAGFKFSDLAFLVVMPTFLLELVMLCLLRGGELFILRPGVLLQFDMSASIDLFLGWLGAALGLGSPLVEPVLVLVSEMVRKSLASRTISGLGLVLM